MKEETKKKKGSKKKFFRRLFFGSLLISLVALGFLYFLDVVPLLYFGGLVFIVFLYDFIMAFLVLSKGWKRRMFGTIFTFLKTVFMLVIVFYSVSTLDFLYKIGGGNYNTENYSVLVLNSSGYETLKDIRDKKIGIVKLGDDKGLLEAKLHLNKKTSLEYVELPDLNELVNSLLSRKIDAILIEAAQRSLLEEESTGLSSNEKIIYQFSVDLKINDGLVKNVDITKNAFNIFISGIDSYGKITSVSRSDVNMVVSINPQTHKVLLTSIPRDYYVFLHGIDSKYKDKITHAGIHGIDTSVKTVEDLLGIDINYYAKVNFTSLIKIVDELGGIDIELDKGFRAYYIEEGETTNYTFKKGSNHLNGKQALAFARERKSLAEGDVGRVKHQQILIEGILKKALSKNIIIKYNDLLNALEGRFITNFGTENITKLVKQQIKDMPSWEVLKNTLKGEDSHNYTYSYKTVKSYVMEPDLDSVREASEMIHSFLKETE